MEVGKRLMEKKCQAEKLRDMSAEEYLEKARGLFTESEMRTITDELDRLLTL